MLIIVTLSSYPLPASNTTYDYEFRLGYYNLYISREEGRHKKDPEILRIGSNLSQQLIVIGKIYSKCDLKEATVEEIRSLEEMSVDRITKLFWGDFILIRQSPKEGEEVIRLEIVRSLNSQTPIFYSSCLEKDRIVLSTKLSDILKMTGKQINYPYIKTFLTYGNFVSQYTPYDYINEIPIGCLLKIGKDLSLIHKVLWDPSYFTSNTEYNKEESQEKIFHVLHNLTTLYTSSYKNILLDYSGGVDSTGLLYIIKDAIRSNASNIDLKAINYVNTNIRAADEEEHARNICNELEVKLVRHDTSNFLPFTPFYENFSPNYLSSLLVYLADENAIGVLADHLSHKETVFISGHGGDHIFCCPPLLDSISDYWKTKRFKGLIKKVKEISSYERSNIVEVLKLVLFANTTPTFQPYDSSLFNFTLLDDKEEVVWPMEHSIALSNCPKGKATQIRGLYHAFATLNIDIRQGITSLPIIYPLLSQPLIEAVLSIPTYELYGKGYDRLFFREMIAKKYKNAKIWRKEKGETTGVLQLGIKGNLKAIKELVSEGFLASNNIINLNHTIQALELISRGYSHNLTPIMNIISVELFLKNT